LTTSIATLYYYNIYFPQFPAYIKGKYQKKTLPTYRMIGIVDAYLRDGKKLFVSGLVAKQGPSTKAVHGLPPIRIILSHQFKRKRRR